MASTVNFSIEFPRELNAPQWEAVSTTEGPLLILAGAGSGKTRALTYRFAYIVASELARPEEILAVTFTNKASKEMLERATKLLNRVGVPFEEHPPWKSPLWISTFHSTCARILRNHIELLGYDKNFTIYDDGDQLSVIKKVCIELNINDKIFPPKTFQFSINKLKNEYVSPQSARTKKMGHFMDEKIAAVYSTYESYMKKSNAVDFGDLLYKTTQLFEQNPTLLEQYQDRFKYIMVDEYQDTNHVQYVLVKMLASKHKNLCVVGDEDQSIYSWRGADITNILNFEKDFPEAKIIKLEENYRSTKNIVEAASHVIKKNSQRKDKTLWTSNDAGSPISIKEDLNEFEEARSVVKEIAALARDDQRQLNEFAIFYRTNAQSRVLEDQLRANNIAYRIVGGTKFYDRAEIKDILSYLKVCVNPKDDVALKRIINVPTRGIGKTSVEKLEAYAQTKGTSLFESILPSIQEKALDRGAAQKILNFYEILCPLIEKATSRPPLETFHQILDVTEYVQKLKMEDTPEALSRVENLEELDSAIHQFQKERGEEALLPTFLEEISLVTDQDKNAVDETQTVTLMTLHVSKGLEYPVVFIVGLEEGLFPSIKDSASLYDDADEEERRLFYVGMTRARQKLYLSHARTRKVWGNEQMNPPSRFLAELPAQYVKKSSRIQVPQWQQAASSGKSSWKERTSDHDGDANSTMPSYDDFEYDEGLRKGMRVRHPSFGVGIIHQLEGHGEDQKVSILFPNNMLKKFVVKFARLEKA